MSKEKENSNTGDEFQNFIEFAITYKVRVTNKDLKKKKASSKKKKDK